MRPTPASATRTRGSSALAKLSPVIHLQQTVLHRSNHAPFTPEHNAAGIIEPEKVLAAIRKSGCTKSLLAFEIGHREH